MKKIADKYHTPLALAALLVIHNRLSLAQARLTMILVGQTVTYLIIYVFSPVQPN
ncbi:MAG: hypothetical protein HXX08_09170 [Chloroflexi bacterium]|uniref:Uncharacterized protein n=1 Tax=Candidatus Chlorohelix allophototropha TaxID=3003348 RepID=A0A8T7LVH9_9CHLR|nr:hypothetical protein [Chloroflexota bacterium]WJW67894.1 hypothetical protein OZ401_001178 [Chloroflexota bacterium L227-S17]